MTLVTKCYHVHFVPSSNYEPLDHKQNIKVQPQAAAEATIANSTLCQETHGHIYTYLHSHYNFHVSWF